MELLEAADRALAHLESFSMHLYTDAMTNTSKINFTNDLINLRRAIEAARAESR